MKTNEQKQNPMMPLTHNPKEQGSALPILLFFAVLISLVAGNVASLARQQMHISRLVVNRSSAQKIAEGAANQALAYVAQNQDDPWPLPDNLKNGSMGDGEYDVTLDNSNDGYFSIVATGTVKNLSRTVKVHARMPELGHAFAFAMFSNGNIKLRAPGESIGDIHANQNITIKGNATVNGDASAVGEIEGGSNVTGTSKEGSAPISFPRLNLDHYYAIAEENNEIHDGDLDLSGDQSPAGGVLWVNGDVHISGGGSNSVEFTGMLIATGDIHQASHYTHNQKDKLPAMVSRDGNIKLSGGLSDITGMIFAQTGRIKTTGGGNPLLSAIMAWDDIEITTANWDIDDNNPTEVEIENADDRIQVLAWEM